MGRGVPFLADWGVGERPELPQRDTGQSPGRKRILAYSEGDRMFFLYLYDNIWGGGTICISVPYSKFWGTCPPRDLRPWLRETRAWRNAVLYDVLLCAWLPALNHAGRVRRSVLHACALYGRRGMRPSGRPSSSE